jgi:hypothetical protein
VLSRALLGGKKIQPHANEIYLDARGMINKVWLFGYSIEGQQIH